MLVVNPLAMKTLFISLSSAAVWMLLWALAKQCHSSATSSMLARTLSYLSFLVCNHDSPEFLGGDTAIASGSPWHPQGLGGQVSWKIFLIELRKHILVHRVGQMDRNEEMKHTRGPEPSLVMQEARSHASMLTQASMASSAVIAQGGMPAWISLVAAIVRVGVACAAGALAPYWGVSWLHSWVLGAGHPLVHPNPAPALFPSPLLV